MNKKKLFPQLITYPSTIDYADGSERAMLDIVSDDTFDEFTTWRGKNDWAQYYHLSPLRRNLVNWITFEKKPVRILELGAGCGAITSYLVEIPNSKIVAVEGSLERAKVIQSRCADSTNLEIHACPIDKYIPDEPFDVITLIGVLEYSGKYEQGKNPFSEVLTRSGKWLKKDGCLIIAIENQLGCKYLSGSPEDHYGTAFEGINGYPHYNGVKTFTYTTLSGLLEQSGFQFQWWYFPYPDYKLPSVIFSEKAFDKKGFDWKGLLDIPPEPNENIKPAFSDRSLLQLLHESGVTKHFMNSFLVVASKDGNCQFNTYNNTSIMAVKSNVKFRAKPFQTLTEFISLEKKVTVVKRKLHLKPTANDTILKHVLSDKEEPYHYYHKNLFDMISESVVHNDPAQIRLCISLWEKELLKHALPSTQERIEKFSSFASKHLDRKLYESFYTKAWLPGKFLDLIPLNILILSGNEKSDEQVKIIDLEWQLDFDIPLQLVFDRGYHLLSNKLQILLIPHKISVNVDSGLPMSFHNELSRMVFFNNRDIFQSQIFETWFQYTVMHGIPEEKLNWEIIIPKIYSQIINKASPSSLEEFIENVVQLVEKGSNKEGIEYFDKYCYLFTSIPQFKEFENVINNYRFRLKK